MFSLCPRFAITFGHTLNPISNPQARVGSINAIRLGTSLLKPYSRTFLNNPAGSSLNHLRARYYSSFNADIKNPIARLRAKILFTLRRRFASLLFSHPKASSTCKFASSVSRAILKLLPGTWSRSILASLSKNHGSSFINDRFLLKSLRFRFQQARYPFKFPGFPEPKLYNHSAFGRFFSSYAKHNPNFVPIWKFSKNHFRHRDGFKPFKHFKRWTSSYFRRSGSNILNQLQVSTRVCQYSNMNSLSICKISHSLYAVNGYLRARREFTHAELEKQALDKTIVSPELVDKSALRLKKSSKVSSGPTTPVVSVPKQNDIAELKVDTDNAPPKQPAQVWYNNVPIPSDRTVVFISLNANYSANQVSSPQNGAQVKFDEINNFVEQLRQAQRKKELVMNRLFELLSSSGLDLSFVNLTTQNNSIAIIFNNLKEAPNSRFVSNLFMNWGLDLDLISATIQDPILPETDAQKDTEFQVSQTHINDPVSEFSSMDLSRSSDFNNFLDSSIFSEVVEQVIEPRSLYAYDVNCFLDTITTSRKPNFVPYTPSSTLLFV
ncbi:hypothetical protein BB560_004881 [Smittium megazygosporum]|uniref:Uncharacterized protein n=1 Tax=Smittium megazygosporum TaxID=133381 RepID=A0A2T9Z856_9FUNG|nr:hypothetical protein BB560_004881 [Smittium megazygosporum]